jgi:sporulation protein YlmC with PRC-barrel domain
MLKKLMVTTAASALLIGAAAAQSTSPAPAPKPASPPPAATAPAPEAQKAPEQKAPEMTQKAPAAKAGEATFVNSQKPDQFLFSSFKGTNVVGGDNEKIGDVSDILFDKMGKIEAYVISVGGFLGIGSKSVALAPSAFEVVPGDKSKNESDKLKLTMNKEQLQKAASFEPYREPARTTTGMGGGTTPPRTSPGGGVGGGAR